MINLLGVCEPDVLYWTLRLMMKPALRLGAQKSLKAPYALAIPHLLVLAQKGPSLLIDVRVAISSSPSNQRAKLTYCQLQISNKQPTSEADILPITNQQQPNSHAKTQSKTNDRGRDALSAKLTIHKLQNSNNTTLNMQKATTKLTCESNNQTHFMHQPLTQMNSSN